MLKQMSGVGASVTVLNEEMVMPRKVDSVAGEDAAASAGGEEAVMTATGCGILRMMCRMCVERSGWTLMFEVAAPRRAWDLGIEEGDEEDWGAVEYACPCRNVVESRL